MDIPATAALHQLQGQLIRAQDHLLSALARRDLAAICEAKRACAQLNRQIEASGPTQGHPNAEQPGASPVSPA
jgi:hypothetical protein